MSLRITNLLVSLLFIGNVFGRQPLPGQILFPDELGKFDFYPTTTLSPAVKIPHQTTTTFDNFSFDINFEMSELNNETLQNFTKYKEEIDQLKSIYDFVNFFNMSLPEDPFEAPVATRVRTAFLDIESAGDAPPYVHSLDQANCLPELATVTLEFEREMGVTYFPTCVRVQRCGGCCYLAHHSCQPTEIENMSVKVIRIQQQVTRARRRNVREAEADFMVVKVEQHNTCNCQCKLQAKDCIKEIHNYNDHQCACVCKNKEAELKCVTSNKHFWNNNKCKCLCRNELACSTGQEFDHETCSCVSTSINIV